MSDCLLGVLWHEFLQVCLCVFMILMGRIGTPICGRKFRPAVGRTHIDNPDRFEAGPWKLYPEQVRVFTVLDTAPELLFGCEQEVLVERIGMNSDFHPFATPCDDRKHGGF